MSGRKRHRPDDPDATVEVKQIGGWRQAASATPVRDMESRTVKGLVEKFVWGRISAEQVQQDAENAHEDMKARPPLYFLASLSHISIQICSASCM